MSVSFSYPSKICRLKVWDKFGAVACSWKRVIAFRSLHTLHCDNENWTKLLLVAASPLDILSFIQELPFRPLSRLPAPNNGIVLDEGSPSCKIYTQSCFSILFLLASTAQRKQDQEYRTPLTRTAMCYCYCYCYLKPWKTFFFFFRREWSMYHICG